MNGKLIYNTRTNVLSSIDETAFLHLDQVIEIKEDVEPLKFHEQAMRYDDYEELMGIVLANSSYNKELRDVIDMTVDDDELVGVVELGDCTENKIYIVDGMIWDWNFKFIVTDN